MFILLFFFYFCFVFLISMYPHIQYMWWWWKQSKDICMSIKNVCFIYLHLFRLLYTFINDCITAHALFCLFLYICLCHPLVLQSKFGNHKQNNIYWQYELCIRIQSWYMHRTLHLLPNMLTYLLSGQQFYENLSLHAESSHSTSLTCEIPGEILSAVTVGRLHFNQQLTLSNMFGSAEFS